MTIQSQQSYLQKHRFAPRQIPAPPPPDLGLVVVIPCFMETQLMRTLESLNTSQAPQCQVEVIIVFNSSEKDPDTVRSFHERQMAEIQAWSRQKGRFSYHCLHFPQLRAKHAGVGLARKIGMDEAVERLALAEEHEGVIVCLDGDTVVNENYLQAIEVHFRTHPKAEACSICFAHPLDGGPFGPEIYQGILRYELFLRYFIEGLRFAAYPYAYHTIGSAMAVRSSAYQKRGGMNRRKAGEDFYFLHKFIPQGGFAELCSTQVTPSPRPSNRVPFGTGKAIRDWLAGEQQIFPAYDPQIFTELKTFLQAVPAYYYQNPAALPPSVAAWATEVNLDKQLSQIRQNVGQASSFPKRFFQWFDALKVLQFVHYARDHFYSDAELEANAAKLLKMMGLDGVIEPKSLLLKYRQLQSIPWSL
jgi:hypothetical protein